MFELELVIGGWPVVKKNGMVKTRHGLMPNKRYRAATERALAELKFQSGVPKIMVKVSAEMHFLVQRAHRADISNLYEAPQDWMQQAGVIANDGLIAHHDGSRQHCLCDTCDEIPIITRGPNKGKRKKTCGHSHKCDKGRTIIILREDDGKDAEEWLEQFFEREGLSR